MSVSSLKYCFISFSFLFLLSCNHQGLKYSPTAHGNPGDIIVVMKTDSWNSEAGDTLRAIFHAYDENCPMEEYLFDLHQIPINLFIDHNKQHRNIIFQNIDPNIKEARIQAFRGKYAENQLFVNIDAPNQAEFVKLVSSNRKSLIDLFLKEDKNRWVAQLKTHFNKTISSRIEEKYNILIKIPLNYVLSEYRDDFAWISHETRTYTSNIIIYISDITDSTSLNCEHLIAMRNKILQTNIPGERQGSYMTTETVFHYPQHEIITHNNQNTGVLRGLWKVHKDFMGGSFVSYTKLDTIHKKMVTVEGFVYYPNGEVRDKIRSLEGVLHTFSLKQY